MQISHRKEINALNVSRQNSPSMPREKEILTDDPDLPFQQVAMDPCQIGGKSYLIYADRYTGWTEAALIKDETFKTVKKELLKFFRTYGKLERRFRMMEVLHSMVMNGPSSPRHGRYEFANHPAYYASE